MKKEKRTKTISVQYSTRVKTEKEVAGQRQQYAQYPKITMEGMWFEKLGFHIGDRLKLEYGDGFINICPAKAGMQPAMVCEDTRYAAQEKEEKACGYPGVKEV